MKVGISGTNHILKEFAYWSLLDSRMTDHSPSAFDKAYKWNVNVSSKSLAPWQTWKWKLKLLNSANNWYIDESLCMKKMSKSVINEAEIKLIGTEKIITQFIQNKWRTWKHFGRMGRISFLFPDYSLNFENLTTLSFAGYLLLNRSKHQPCQWLLLGMASKATTGLERACPTPFAFTGKNRGLKVGNVVLVAL